MVYKRTCSLYLDVRIANFSHNLTSLTACICSLLMFKDNYSNLSCNWCCDTFQAKKKKKIKKKLSKHRTRIKILFICWVWFTFSSPLGPILQSKFQIQMRKLDLHNHYVSVAISAFLCGMTKVLGF